MLKIVIVEDETMVRRGLVQGVDWQAMDCRVVGEAADGEEGLAVIGSTRPDVVFADIRMPKKTGLEMLADLRAQGNPVYVIFLTSYGDFSYAQSAVRLHAGDYLLKPFQDETLEQAIRKAKQYLGQQENECALLPEQNLGGYPRKCAQYIAEHYFEQELGLRTIAKALDISESRLSHLFKEETGYTVNSYITNYRMQKAMELLADCRSRVSEVCEQVGYRDLAYFSAAFKKVAGVTPGEYRRRHG